MAKIQLQIAGLLVLFMGTAPTASNSAEVPGFVPKNGFVPDEKTAVAVAEAILSPIYGQDQIVHERPFHAELDGNDVWKVEGSLPGGLGWRSRRCQNSAPGRPHSVCHARKIALR